MVNLRLTAVKYRERKESAFLGAHKSTGQQSRNPYEELVSYAEEIDLSEDDLKDVLDEETREGLQNRDAEYYEDFEYVIDELMHRKQLKNDIDD